MRINMHRMLNTTVKNFITQHNLIPSGSTVIVGLSGGPDSVYLLHQLALLQQECNFTLHAAHLNHGWRTQAARDEQFCKDLAAHYNIPFHRAHAADFPHIKNNGSPEAFGRTLRRAFLSNIAQELGNASIALAHHEDDQMETFFIRLIRGAGLQGLRGMKPKDGINIRPLLNIRKAEILQFLHENNFSYCVDHTNEEDTYLRNRIRKHAIPALNKCDERAGSSILKSMHHFAELEDYMQQQTVATFAAISEMHDGKRWLDTQKFLALHSYMQQCILLHWICEAQVPFTPSQGLYAEIIRFLQQPGSGTHILYKKWCIIKQKTPTMLAKIEVTT